MTHWEYTGEIKRRSRKARRQAGKTLERQAKQVREEDEQVIGFPEITFHG